MVDRLEEALIAIRLSFPMAVDRNRAAHILESALAELVNDAAVDGLGAPKRPRIVATPFVSWDDLRAAVKVVIHEIGIEAFAAQYGTASPESVLDMVNRRKAPGVATKARMLRLVTGNFSH